MLKHVLCSDACKLSLELVSGLSKQANITLHVQCESLVLKLTPALVTFYDISAYF